MLIYQKDYERREFQLPNKRSNVYIDRAEYLLWRVKILGRYEQFEKKIIPKINKKTKFGFENFVKKGFKKLKQSLIKN